MDTTKLSTKGQVIIPKDIRKARGWQPGEELVVEDRADGVLLRRRKAFQASTLDDVIGSAGYKGPVKTIDEMTAAVDQMFAHGMKRKAR